MRRATLILIMALLAGAAPAARAEAGLKPYVLAWQGADTVAARVLSVKQAVKARGFAVVGEYRPFEGATVVAVTTEALRATAGRSRLGGFAAAATIGVTQVGDKVQVSYLAPRYRAQAYRLADDLDEVQERLEAALGQEASFGARQGLGVAQLRAYHYMVMMPGFTDPVELGSFASHEEALRTVEAGLAARSDEVTRVYRVDVPGKDEVVFGVGVRRGDGADAVVARSCDTGALRHTASWPYELVVSGRKAYMLHGRFRIAVHFPELQMGTFMQIAGAPDGIERVMRKLATP